MKYIPDDEKVYSLQPKHIATIREGLEAIRDTEVVPEGEVSNVVGVLTLLDYPEQQLAVSVSRYGSLTAVVDENDVLWERRNKKSV